MRASISLVNAWLLLALATPVCAQTPLIFPVKPAAEPPAEVSPVEPPLVLRDRPAVESNEAEVDAAIRTLREEMRGIAESSMTAAEQQEAAQKIVDDYPHIFRTLSTEMPTQKPNTVDGVIEFLEKQMLEVAEESAPDEATRRAVRQGTLAQDELEPLRPIYIARRPMQHKIVVTREAEEKGYMPWWKNASAQGKSKTPVPVATAEAAADTPDEPVKVEFLADQQVTSEMHDDTTVLRDVENNEGDLVLFDRLHLWVGGSAQLDGYSMEGLFTQDEGGDRDDEFTTRRAEVIVRASLLRSVEGKVQYDVESELFRDLYLRWISESTSRSVTLGNQKETMGMDYLMGNKFGTAMERSAPASAFAAHRSLGVRYTTAFDLSPERTLLDVWGSNRTYATGNIGFYTKDIEDTHDTDWSVVARVSGGAKRQDESGIHLGVSASYRQGEYDSIAPRPELNEASRITLASFDAKKQAVLGLEAGYTRGPLHGQAEFYYSDYRGGSVNGEGFGGYAQVGWLFGDHTREYRPKWGLWAPIKVQSQHVFEVFGRVSYTRGEDDLETWNDLRIITLGGNWYYRKFRGSLNLLGSQTRRDISGEGAGNAITARIQYLF